MNPSSSWYKGQYTSFFLTWQEISPYQNIKNCKAKFLNMINFESELVLIKIRTQVQVWKNRQLGCPLCCLAAKKIKTLGSYSAFY